jgi:DNA-binding beta-propeller fold protein YncE
MCRCHAVLLIIIAFIGQYCSTAVFAQSQTYRLIESVPLGRKFGQKFPSAPKPFAVGIDANRAQAYITSPIAPFIPVLNLDSNRQVSTLNSPFPSPSSSGGDALSVMVNSVSGLVYLFPSPLLIPPERDSIKTLFAVHPFQNQVVTTCSYSTGIRDIALHRSTNRLLLADGNVVRIIDGQTLQSLDSAVLSFTIGALAIDSVKQQFYAIGKEPVQGQIRINIHKFSAPAVPVKSFVIAFSSTVHHAFIDTNWTRLLVVGTTQAKILQLGSNVVLRTIMFGGNYTQCTYSPQTERLYLMQSTGYASNGERGNFGKLLSLGTIDEARDSARLGLRTTSIALDEMRSRLAVVAEQQATLDFYDLTTLALTGSIELAKQFDDIAVAPDGSTAYMVGHLGKHNRVFMYNFPTQELSEVTTGTWTVGLAVDSSRGRVFALSQQENSIYVLSTYTNTVIGKIPIFGFKESRSDALFSMSLDKARQKMYVAMPELKNVAMIDLATSAMEKSLKILGYSFDIAETGAGKLQMALAPDVNKLYVLRTGQKRLNVYNLTNATLIDSINITSRWTSAMETWSENLLMYDPVQRRIFVGSVGVDCLTNRLSGQTLPQASRFLGYNPKETILYSLAKNAGVISVQEHNPQTLAVTVSRPLYTSNEDLAPLSYMDTRRNHLLLLDRAEGILHRYDLNTIIGAIAARNDVEIVTLSISPNPVRSQTTVRFGVKKKERVRIGVYDEHGREVTVLTDNEYEAGTHTITLKVESTSYKAQNYVVRLKSPSMSYSRPFQIQR